MRFSIEIPDEVADAMSQAGHDPARAALEGVAIEGYRTGALTAYQTRTLLGLSRYELDGFLKSHNVQEGAYDIADYEQDCKTLEELDKKRRQPHYTIEELVKDAKPRRRTSKEDREWLDAPRVGRELL